MVAPIQVVVRDDRLGDGEPHLLRRIAERKNELKSGTESAVELWSEFLRVHGERSGQKEMSLTMDAVDTLSKTNLVLGFVDYCKHERNMPGNEVQRQVELTKVFFGIYRVEGDLPFKYTEVKRVLSGLVPLSLLEQAELARSNLAKRTYCLTIEEYLQVVLVEFAKLNPLIADELKEMRDMTAGAVQQKTLGGELDTWQDRQRRRKRTMVYLLGMSQYG